MSVDVIVSESSASDMEDYNKSILVENDKGPYLSTFLLLRLRWRMIRSKFLKVIIVCAAIIFIMSLYSVMNLGYLVQMAAQQGGESAQSIYALAWISSLDSGYISSLGALAIGGAVAVAFFAPFTGTSTLALVPSDDLLSVRPNRKHRFWDALIINSGSGIGLLQLLTLTAVTSLITLDGSRTWAMIFTWSLWFFLIVVNTSIGFTLEWLNRKWGPRERRIVGISLFLILAVAVLLDDKKGTDLFGFAHWYTDILRYSVDSFSLGSMLAIGTILLATILLILLGLRITSVAFSLPERSGSRGAERKSKVISGSPLKASVLLLWRTFSRTKECRRPILAIIIIGAPIAAFTTLDQTLTIAFTMTVPLAVALGWGVNIFGVIGQGMNWLSSQPYIMKTIPRSTAAMQAITVTLLLTCFWTIGFFTGNATAASAKPMLIGALVSSLMTSAISTFLSIKNPVRAPLTGRGDALVPPVTALIYLLILVFLGCLPGVLLTQSTSNTQQILGLVISVLVAASIAALSWKMWDNPAHRAKVASKVSVE